MTIARYREFRKALKATPCKGKFMPYGWSALPDPLPIRWMAYSQMLQEVSNEIANSINDLTRYTHQLEAWNAVISPLDDNKRFEVAHEFIDPLATLALNLPYVIRSRFIFATAHLSNQANSAKLGKTWSDDLPLDDEIFFSAADLYGKHWVKYAGLKTRLEKIAGKDMRTATSDFRNTYNHRFSRRIVLGHTNVVTRYVNPATKAVSYGFGGLPPLTLEVVIEQLKLQCTRCYAAFGAFQKLVKEHEDAIVKTL